MAFETFSVTLDKDKTLIFETGKIARQADGAVLVKMNETWVFSSACAASLSEAVDFLPFRVDYQEKFSSAGKTSGGFLKREGRPSEKEILVSRLIDRSLRPSFPNRLMQDIQILSYVWSYDGKTLPDPLAICGASAALAISEVPQNCINDIGKMIGWESIRFYQDLVINIRPRKNYAALALILKNAFSCQRNLQSNSVRLALFLPLPHFLCREISISTVITTSIA